MKILVVGSGGREHAFVWKLQQSEKVAKIYAAPGNFGTSLEPKTVNINIAADQISELLSFASEHEIDLTLVGPEVPLVLGIVDRFQESGLRCFGPTQDAAQLEGSKVFTKQFLTRHNIPTAEYERFADVDLAIQHLEKINFPAVIKADGLAAGKGVIIAENLAEAKKAVIDILVDGQFGEAGKKIVIERYLSGVEASYICVVNGEQILPMAASQDHKAAFDGDKGPNTGGMGAYSPTPFVDSDVESRILDQIIRPTVHGLCSEGINYTGFLYAGLMIDHQGNPKVLEFNCRFGDPETQPILMRMKSDLVDVLLATLDQKLDNFSVSWDERAALGVVVAADGYPHAYSTGGAIKGLAQITENDVKVFHAGTAKGNNNSAVVSGGRVLCVTALGRDINSAKERAYDAVYKVSMDKMHYRTDIGDKALLH